VVEMLVELGFRGEFELGWDVGERGDDFPSRLFHFNYLRFHIFIKIYKIDKDRIELRIYR
jgi:hypothetical protein